MVGNIVGLASGAELLLCDEPYVGLDTHNTDVLYRHLLDLTDSGRTVIVATHHIADAAKLLDSALILGRDGKVAAHLTPEDADVYVVATGSFDKPYGALAYQRSPAGDRAILPAETAEHITGVRVKPVDFDELIDAALEVN